MSITKPRRPQDSAPDLDILGDQVTIHPAGYVAPPSAGQEGQERNLVEHMARFRESPFDFLREVSLHVSGTGWRAYEDVIGQPIFYNGFTDNMKAAVMRTPMLNSRIEELAARRVEVEDEQGLLGDGDSRHRRKAKRKMELEESLREVAEKLTDGMICKLEYKSVIRGAYYICIHVSSEEVLRLRSVAEQAAEKKHSIIFLPCHRSHVDYVALQILCYRLGIAVPTVVAGDNLNFPVIGPFLQHAGAMWIRRSFGHDSLYTTLVQSYIDTLLQNGFNFECFIEGGRSRTGKLLSPKFGILSFLLDSVLSGRVEDAVICPVSTQYDKVIETESYISELLGQPKPKENLKDFLSASSVLSLKLGRVDVRFHEPWSLKTFIAEQRTRVESSSPSPTLQDPQSSESRIRLLRTLGFKVLSDVNAVSVVMPTALVGTVLLTLRGRGVNKKELVRRVEWLSDRVRDKGGRVAHFAGAPTEVVVERALDVLGPEMIGTIDDLPETVYYAVDRFQLSFYRNMTIHLFISEALVSAAMYTRVKLGGGPDIQRISFDALYDQVYRGEFIYPTAGLLTNLNKTLQGLEADDIIVLTRDSADRILTAELSNAERQKGRENYDFYCFLIWPFIESTWLAAVSLMSLTPPSLAEKDVCIDIKQVQDKAQLAGKTLYHQGDLSYFEAVNKETLKNAYQLFEEEGMIIHNKSKDPKIPSTVRLAPEWTPTRDEKTGSIVPQGKLWQFTEMIAQSRREGKNRRDGATVSTRVLALADKVGRELLRAPPHQKSTLRVRKHLGSDGGKRYRPGLGFESVLLLHWRVLYIFTPFREL
ncbi:acyltransferase [Physcia stellaris]|nr:acyltransferase [Physcia stellaris]